MVAFWDKFTRKARVGAKAQPVRVGVPADAPKAPKAASVKRSPDDTREAPRVLLRPLLTEKASRLADDRQYVFAVATSATRIGVARAVTALYGIRPARVNIVRVKGKQVRFGQRTGREKDWKKAVVTLPAGKTIAVYDGV